MSTEHNQTNIAPLVLFANQKFSNRLQSYALAESQRRPVFVILKTNTVTNHLPEAFSPVQSDNLHVVHVSETPSTDMVLNILGNHVLDNGEFALHESSWLGLRLRLILRRLGVNRQQFRVQLA
jgi:hypothetical protein